ncbi:MAG: 50S ribosomal protein L3 [Kiritimatiellae bacterium]|nr:50S ribosomal protein L3 [Kiritimatiellia bacterium]MBO7299349.1 50S ribosomal protein L3 [Kiritimatiellia bacterium]MBQ2281402.1 50S ribosomal protein L3 [Kiritimatiellia bacterium]
MEGLIGKKIGMTQIWDADGVRIPVTVIEAGPCPVVQVKTTEKDGYEAVQLGWGSQKASRLSKAEVAHCAKAGLETPVRVLREFKADAGEEVKAGDVYTVSVFENIGYVDVIGTSKGHGFQGVMKRWSFQGGPMTHGSHTKRRPGSIGMRQDPGSVEKGHPMPGHMGARRVTTQNLKVVQVRPEQNIILVKGAIPGPNGGMVIVRKSIKKAVKA